MQVRVLYLTPTPKNKGFTYVFLAIIIIFNQRFKNLFNFKNRREKMFVNVEQAKGYYTFADKHDIEVI